MKLHEFIPDNCHSFKIPYNHDMGKHWEFIFEKSNFNKQGIAIISETTEVVDCHGVSIVIPNPIDAVAGGYFNNNYLVYLKGFDVNYSEDIYVKWTIVVDDGDSLTLYSDWFRNYKCITPVGVLKPCLDVEETVLDINGDWVGAFTLDYFNLSVGIFPAIPRLTGLSYYSPQLYLRCGHFYENGFEYEMKKAAFKLMKVTQKKIWKLDGGDIGSNYVSVANSVLGFGKIFDFQTNRFYELDELQITLVDKYWKHKYFHIEASAYEFKNIVKGCDDRCAYSLPSNIP